MKVLINPKIIICEAIKNKRLNYSIVLEKKNPHHLTIKVKSVKGRGLGYAGLIDRSGRITYAEKHNNILRPLIDQKLISKIDLTLDLIYGKNRDKIFTINKNGLIEFKR